MQVSNAFFMVSKSLDSVLSALSRRWRFVLLTVAMPEAKAMKVEVNINSAAAKDTVISTII